MILFFANTAKVKVFCWETALRELKVEKFNVDNFLQ